MLLDDYLYGWEHLEPAIIGCICQRLNVLLLGKHGTGKSSLTRFLADALTEGDETLQFRRYAMDKENMISMVGIPNPAALSKGKLEYAKHDRSILDADVVLFDEITRAPKDNQNLVLEVLEERTVLGKPLKYRFAIATANDETYQATYKLDPALLDRFAIVLPVPTTGQNAAATENFASAEELRALIDLNLRKRNKNIGDANKRLTMIFMRTSLNLLQDISL
jgi:MoxR-like ATPase